MQQFNPSTPKSSLLAIATTTLARNRKLKQAHPPHPHQCYSRRLMATGKRFRRFRAPFTHDETAVNFTTRPLWGWGVQGAIWFSDASDSFGWTWEKSRKIHFFWLLRLGGTRNKKKTCFLIILKVSCFMKWKKKLKKKYWKKFKRYFLHKNNTDWPSKVPSKGAKSSFLSPHHTMFY